MKNWKMSSKVLVVFQVLGLIATVIAAATVTIVGGVVYILVAIPCIIVMAALITFGGYALVTLIPGVEWEWATLLEWEIKIIAGIPFMLAEYVLDLPEGSLLGLNA